MPLAGILHVGLACPGRNGVLVQSSHTHARTHARMHARTHARTHAHARHAICFLLCKCIATLRHQNHFPMNHLYTTGRHTYVGLACPDRNGLVWKRNVHCFLIQSTSHTHTHTHTQTHRKTHVVLSFPLLPSIISPTALSGTTSYL